MSDERPDWFADISVKATKPAPIEPQDKADRVGPRQRETTDKTWVRCKAFWNKPCVGGCGRIHPKTYKGITGLCRSCSSKIGNPKGGL